MLNWQRPNSRKKIQSLLGILNFFRRFVYNFTERVYPIMQIKQRRFKWEQQPGAEAAYLDLYDALVKNGPFIHFPDLSVPLELATDASEHSIGAVLFQTVNKEVKILGYNSRVLKETELRYSIPKKELISILYHVKYYRHLLYGRRFHLYTDSESVASILQSLDAPKKNTILLGWISELAEFDFIAHHIRGEDNLLADLASRVQAVHSCEDPNPDYDLKLTTAEMEMLLDQVHRIGHWGAAIMYRHIVMTLGITNIPNLLNKCIEYTKGCPACLRVNKYTQAYAPPRIPSFWTPMEYMSADLMELSVSDAGYKYILVLFDIMSSFVQLKALKTKEMHEIIPIMLNMFLTFGFPHQLKTDNGAEFDNRMLKELAEAAFIQHKRVIAYDHHANGEVERAIRSVRDTLLKLVIGVSEETYSAKWEDLVPITQFALNNKVHHITGMTPFELVFGRSAFQKSSLKLMNIEDSQEILAAFWNTFHREIPPCIRNMKLKFQSKSAYPKRVVVFKEGDTVVHLLQRSSKHDDNYTGPYKVIKVLEHGHYLIESPAGVQVEAPANFLKIASAKVTESDLKPFDPFEPELVTLEQVVSLPVIDKVSNQTLAVEDGQVNSERRKQNKRLKEFKGVGVSNPTTTQASYHPKRPNRSKRLKPQGFYLRLADGGVADNQKDSDYMK